MAIGNYRVSLKIVSFFRGVTMDMFSLQGTFNACIHNVTCCIRQNSILYRSMDLRDQSSEVNNSSRYPRKHEIMSLFLSLSLSIPAQVSTRITKTMQMDGHSRAGNDF